LSQQAVPIQNGAAIRGSLLAHCQECVRLLFVKSGISRRVRQIFE
jgi:hypothetical protein